MFVAIRVILSKQGLFEFTRHKFCAREMQYLLWSRFQGVLKDRCSSAKSLPITLITACPATVMSTEIVSGRPLVFSMKAMASLFSDVANFVFWLPFSGVNK